MAEEKNKIEKNKIEKNKMLCKRCGYRWNYVGGKLKIVSLYSQYVSCPKCLTSVKIMVGKEKIIIVNSEEDLKSTLEKENLDDSKLTLQLSNNFAKEFLKKRELNTKSHAPKIEKG